MGLPVQTGQNQQEAGGYNHIQPVLAVTSSASYNEMTDAELVVLCQRDDRAAFGVLVKRHQRRVHGLLYKLVPTWQDTADLAQEVFIRMWCHIRQLRDPAALNSWLRQIVVNLLYDELRRKPRRVHAISIDATSERDGRHDDTKEIRGNGPEPDELCESKQLMDAVQAAVQELPEHYRTAIVLREFQGRSYSEIAEMTNSVIGTVKSRISRARQKVQQKIEPYTDQGVFRDDRID